MQPVIQFNFPFYIFITPKVLYDRNKSIHGTFFNTVHIWAKHLRAFTRSNFDHLLQTQNKTLPTFTPFVAQWLLRRDNGSLSPLTSSWVKSADATAFNKVIWWHVCILWAIWGSGEGFITKKSRQRIIESNQNFILEFFSLM